MPDGTRQLFFKVKKRFEIDSVVSEEPYITATLKSLKKRPESKDTEFLAILSLSKNWRYK
jgi:ATP-dependent Lon protease